MRHTSKALVAAAALLLPTAALAGKASTTRIETRPFYGATVTLEEGVRVFRPLPYHDRVIINPGGKTPLSLSYEDSRNYNYNYNHERSAMETGGGDYAGGGTLAGGPVGDGFIAGPQQGAKRPHQAKPHKPHAAKP
jgi:hypothetical protein